MADIAKIWNVTNGDYVLDPSLYAQQPILRDGGDLVSAILNSLFTDRVANSDDDISDGSGDPRGWWGDAGLGSRLWLLERAKLTPDVAKAAIDYASESLRWLIDDGVVSKFDIATEIVHPGQLSMSVLAHKADGTILAQKYLWVWGAVN